MALTTAQFWKLAADSRLLSPDEWQQLDAAYRTTPGANDRDAIRLAQWLVSKRTLTAYQAKVLLSGRAGPFIYGEYRVDDLIDSGRRAGLFRAKHMPTGHRVALYALAGVGATERARLMLARQKVEVARRAAHPLLLACHEMVEIDGMRFIVLEDLAGQSLEEHLAAHGSLPVSEACRVGQLSALALTCLHELRQAHGELRPANIWFGKTGEIKVLQVPLSRDPLAGLNSINDSTFDAEQRLSVVADYSAPELTQIGRAPHPAADVYALGCTLYLALAGRVPFSGGDWRQKSARHANEPVEPLARIGVPVLVSKAILEMLAKDPNQRPSMLQVAKSLIRHAAPNPKAAPEPPTLNAYERLLIQRRAAQPAVSVPPAKVPAAPARQTQPAESDAVFSMAPAIELPPPDPMSASTPAAPQDLPPWERPPRPMPPQQHKLSRHAKQQYAMLGAAIVFLLFAIVLAAVTITSRHSEPVIVDAPAPKQIRRPLPPSVPQRPADEPIASTTGRTGSDSLDLSNAPTRFATIAQPSVLLTGVQEVDDDGRSLWVPPTKGSPLKLTDVAPGLQWFLVLRPAQLLEQPGIEKVFAAIGPAAGWAREQIEAIAGVPCPVIDQLTVAAYEGTDALPALSFVLRLRHPMPLAELRKAWHEPRQDSCNGHAYYQGPHWAYFLPPAENDQLLVIADASRMKQIIEADGAVPPLPPRLEWLLAYTDNQRLLTFGFFPPDLSDDNGPLAALPAGLRARSAWLMTDSAKVALLSAHLDNQLFAELRLRGNTEDPKTFANRLRERFVKIAADVSSLAESGLAAGSNPASSPQFVLAQMLRTVLDYSRVGIEDEQLVVRWYLPGAAAPHLAAAAMTLAPSSSETSEGGADRAGSVADKLNRTIDLSFPRETLESSLGMLSREIGVPIEILGGDLQLEGITKNHSFGLDERQRSAGEILRKILWQANPDGKLVYVIKSKQPGDREMLFVTTRAAAKKRGDTIPPELDQQSK